MVISTCLGKFDYDLALDESLQFLSSLGLNALNYSSLASWALLRFLLVVLGSINSSVFCTISAHQPSSSSSCFTKKQTLCFALEMIALRTQRKYFPKVNF